MDRLSAVIAAVLATAACDDRRGDAPADPPSRVDSAKVGAQKGASVEAFCDAYFAAADAPRFALPALAAAAAPAPAASTWRWINVWATWCKPCIEEMPRLLQWRDRLARAGRRVDLVFVSVDESDAAVAAFRTQHPATPPSVRLADPAAQATWFKTIGIDAGAPIPIHVFVGPSGRTRCARAGGVRDPDYAIVERLLGE